LVMTEANFPSVASDGTLLLRTGGGTTTRQLVWLDRQGNTIATIGNPEEGLDLLSGPALSPDGRRVAISQTLEGQESDIWIFDTERGTKTRLTFDTGSEEDPVWTPDGTRIVYSGSAEGCNGIDCSTLLVRSADGTGAPDTLARGFLAEIAPDGRTLVLTTRGKDVTDIATMPLEPGATVKSVGSEDEVQVAGPVSPTGRWVAYTSFESGRAEVYLRRFPTWGGKWQVSTTGGNCPRWNGTGDRLYYAHDDDYYEVEVSGQDSPVLGAPRRLFSMRPSGRIFRDMTAYFDVSRDGQRFLVVRSTGSNVQGSDVVVVQNWFEEFRSARKK